ncbi:hypothetical protein KC350_g17833, partial [Hortaea werneckii]
MASTHVVAASGDEPAVIQTLRFCKSNWYILLPLILLIRFLYYRYSSPLRHYPGPFLASGSPADAYPRQEARKVKPMVA